MSDGEDIIRTGTAAYLVGVTERILLAACKGETDWPIPPHWRTPGGQLRFSRRRLIEWRDSLSREAEGRPA